MRRGELILNLAFLFLPLVALGLLPIFLFGIAYPLSLLLIAVGFIIFLKAKISVIKTGKIISFGPGEMCSIDKRFYFFGYSMMILGFLLAFAQHFQWI